MKLRTLQGLSAPSVNWATHHEGLSLAGRKLSGVVPFWVALSMARFALPRDEKLLSRNVAWWQKPEVVV